jgi:hypothetical protein
MSREVARPGEWLSRRVTRPSPFRGAISPSVRSNEHEKNFAQWDGTTGIERIRRGFLYWGDAHFLTSATHHMNEALEGLPSVKKIAETT